VTDPSPDQSVKRIAAALEAAGVPYMITGSIAGAYHGLPRATQDIDVVIDPSTQTLQRFLAQFPEPDFYVSQEAATDALKHRAMFNIIELETGWKFDLIIRKNRAFSRAEFERRQPRPGTAQAIYVTSPEDLILAKLEWAKTGGSARQLEDVASILRIQGPTLDTSYIETWTKQLDIQDFWQQVKPYANP